MTQSQTSTGWMQANAVLDALQRRDNNATGSFRLDIDRQLERLSRTAVELVGDVRREVMKVEQVRCAAAVRDALDRSDPRFKELIAAQFAGLDSTVIWTMLQAVAKEVAIYVGGGAVFGAVVGGAIGALGFGAGAVPGAAFGAGVGADLGVHLLAWMGLAGLAVGIIEVVPQMCKHMSEGFAAAWQAGKLPDTAHGAYATLMRSATESFAIGQLLLVKAILLAIVAYLTKFPTKAPELVRLIGNSKLGPAFGKWVGANSDKLLQLRNLRPTVAAAEGEAATAAKAAATKHAPPAEPVPPAKPDLPKKEGEASIPCPPCVTLGAPVNPISGSKILFGELDLDFALPAPLPLVWQRTYSSAQRLAGWLGQGWSTPLSEMLKVSVDEVVVLDAYQRDITFSLPRVGESIYSPSEKITLVRSGDRAFELSDESGQRNLFTMPATANDIAYLVGMVDPNGNRITIAYNQRQLPERIEDSAGRVFMLEFADHRGHPRLRSIGLLQEADAPPELLAQYDYDAAGNLSEVRNRLGKVTRQFAYRNHVMVEHSQPGGLVSRYEYDEYAAAGKVTRNWTNSGLSWSLRYRPQETIVTDNLGREQIYRFDQKGRLIGQVDAVGGVTTRRLDSNGNLLAITDPAGRSTSYRYDERSRVVRVERGGKGTGIVYDARFDKPALVTDALGATTVLRYDEHGNLTSVTDALGQRTAYQYDQHGLPVKVTDPAGGVKRLAYNRAAQLISYTDCSGNSTHFSYDDDGRLVRATDANGNATVYSYGASTPTTTSDEPAGASEHYDDLGRLIARVDQAGNRTSYELDSDGKPLKRIDARGGVLEYRYDDARRMSELINENGDVHRFVYDALDRLAEETGFDARLTRYRYDDSGLVVAKEEYGSGVRSEFTRIDTNYLRDSAGQLVEKIISRTTGEAQAEQLRLRYAYDEVGRMTQAINADAEVSLQYDALGQLVAEHTLSGGDTTVLRHAYDELGNRIQTVLPDGRVLNNLFYGSGHLHQINIDGEVITDIERDRTHRAISRTQGALTSQFRYDPVGRLLSQIAGQVGVGEGADLVIARNYEYDEAGNLLAIDDMRSGRTTYSYDVIGRILSAVQPQSEERFAFDPAHNLLDTTVAGVGRVEGNRVRVFEDKRYDYDAHGNLSEKLIGRHTRMRFEWNAAHQLVKAVVTRNAQRDQPTVQTVKYAYDPFGRRISKRDAFGTTRFAWDGNRLLCETRGQWGRTYVYEPGSFVPLAQVDSAQRSEAEAGAESAPVVHYLHTDHLGTPREATDRDGGIAWAATFKAWGNVLTVEALAPAVRRDPSAQAETLPEVLDQFQAIRFQGQYHDVETGLHYNRFRYYDPDCGRFISCDPIGLLGGNNLHAYAPNPTAWVDPLGLTGCKSCGANSAKNSAYTGDELAGDFVGPLSQNSHANLTVGRVTAPIDFDGHILAAEIKANGNVIGGHSIANGKVQVIPGTASAPNAQGVYSARVQVVDPGNPGQFLPKTNNGGISTLFPDSWTANRIKVEVDAAYQSRTVVGNKWTGTTPSGVRVEGFVSPKITVYPKF